ncbi:MAG TPA: hypothetical protein VEF89_05495 [Solirubrobacteraceae bacterium]|nr:hypothetical protein [Solirubrobacteraceae bacterium]
MSGPEIVALNGGSAPPLAGAAARRGEAVVGVCADVVRVLSPDVLLDAEADAATERAAIDDAATGARVVAAPHAVSIVRLITSINARGITHQE